MAQATRHSSHERRRPNESVQRNRAAREKGQPHRPSLHAMFVETIKGSSPAIVRQRLAKRVSSRHQTGVQARGENDPKGGTMSEWEEIATATTAVIGCAKT